MLRRRSTILRIAVAAGVAAAALSASVALGQPVQAPTLPRVDIVLPAPARMPADDPPAPSGIRVSAGLGQLSRDPVHAQMATVNATTRGCAGSINAESSLGLLKHTGMYAHCDYP